MAETTKIEWCDHTFNPWIGCTKVSPACDHCYAEALARRYGWAEWGAGKPRLLTSDANWKKPLAWNRAAQRDGVRRRVFCASLADIFDTEVPDEWRGEFFAQLVDKTPHLDWLLLTKRPQVAAKWFAQEPAPPNVWLGTTVEDQKMAALRIPTLLSVKVAKRFLSCEPLLGPLSFRWGRWDPWERAVVDHLDGLRMLDWIICGGESGHGARPMHPNWARTLRDECREASVAFFFKQWGEWEPREEWSGHLGGGRFETMRAVMPDGSDCPPEVVPQEVGAHRMALVGKKRAGAKLDGREWREFPT